MAKGHLRPTFMVKVMVSMGKRQSVELKLGLVLPRERVGCRKKKNKFLH